MSVLSFLWEMPSPTGTKKSGSNSNPKAWTHRPVDKDATYLFLLLQKPFVNLWTLRFMAALDSSVFLRKWWICLDIRGRVFLFHTSEPCIGSDIKWSIGLTGSSCFNLHCLPQGGCCVIVSVSPWSYFLKMDRFHLQCSTDNEVSGPIFKSWLIWHDSLFFFFLFLHSLVCAAVNVINFRQSFKKKSVSLDKMFFLPHNLWCLCRKEDNPVWSHQSVQLITMKWKLKMEEVVCVGRGAYIPSLDFSTIPLSCQSYWSALLFTFHSTHGLLIKSIRLSNFRQIRWDEKALCPCGSSDCEDLHCWFILENPPGLLWRSGVNDVWLTEGNEITRSNTSQILQLPVWKSKIHSNCPSSSFTNNNPIGIILIFFFQFPNFFFHNGSFSVHVSLCQTTAMTGTLPFLLQGFLSLSPLSFVILFLHPPKLPWLLHVGGSRRSKQTMTLGKEQITSAVCNNTIVWFKVNIQKWSVMRYTVCTVWDWGWWYIGDVWI